MIPDTKYFCRNGYAIVIGNVVTTKMASCNAVGVITLLLMESPSANFPVVRAACEVTSLTITCANVSSDADLV